MWTSSVTNMRQSVTEEVLGQLFGDGYSPKRYRRTLEYIFSNEYSFMRRSYLMFFEDKSVYLKSMGRLRSAPAAKVTESINKWECYDDRGVREDGLSR